MRHKQATSIRLTPEARALLKAIAARLGVSQAAILELLIRQEAARLAVTTHKE